MNNREFIEKLEELATLYRKETTHESYYLKGIEKAKENRNEYGKKIAEKQFEMAKYLVDNLPSGILDILKTML